LKAAGVRCAPTATASTRLAPIRRVDGVLIQEGVGGLRALDATLVAERDDRVSESGALLWGVDLFGDCGQRVPAPVRIVVLDGLAQALQVGSDQGGQRDQQRVVEAGHIDQSFPEDVERVIGEVGQRQAPGPHPPTAIGPEPQCDRLRGDRSGPTCPITGITRIPTGSLGRSGDGSACAPAAA
jgi:hypothetical protein